MTRDLLRRVSLFVGRVPRYLPVGYPSPQHEVRVDLLGLGAPIDVTHTHVMIALRPLALALAPSPGLSAEALARDSLSLRVYPRSDKHATLGVVDLRQAGAITVGETALQLFHQNGSVNRCMPPAAQAVFAAHHAWGDWKRRNQRNTPMERRDLEAVQVLYICPRPVVLVTVRHGDASNLFPMDLIGQTDSPYFLLGLRNTSPSIALIKEARRLAVSDVPLEYTARAFKLGEHHSKLSIEWDTLPFATAPSAGHGLPVPRDALRVRDLVVRDVRVVGSHTLFVTEVAHDERRREGLQMCFVAGAYYRRLALRGAAPPLGM